MESYATDKIRNIGLFGHQGCGKTSLAEAMLYVSGAIERLGSVDAGNTQTDCDPDEIQRKMTIATGLAPCEWDGHKINVLDTPGFFDFVADQLAALRVTEGAVLVGSAVSGVEVGLEKLWQMAEERSIPRILFVNQMDKENADFQRFLEEAQEKLKGSPLVPLQIPIGAAEKFRGLVNLVTRRAYEFNERGDPREVELPEDLRPRLDTLREKLVETAAEANDELTEKYLETLELSDGEIREGIYQRIRAGTAVPVFCGSALNLQGVSTLLDAVVKYVPDPGSVGPVEGVHPDSGEAVSRQPVPDEPLAALVFKTTTDPYVGKLTSLRIYSGVLHPDSVVKNPNRDTTEKIASLFCLRGKNQMRVERAAAGDIVTVAKLAQTLTGDTLCDPQRPMRLPDIPFPPSYYTRALYPRTKADEDRLSDALARLLHEDPTLQVQRVEETRETLLSGVGDLQVNLCVDRLKRLGVEVETATPKVPYRETLRKKITQHYRHKKQTGGRGQFADVHLELEPLPRGGDFEFVDRIVGGVVPKNYIPAVEKGIRKAMQEGVLAGYTFVDVRATLFDGKHHEVDSSDIAFQIAASMAFKEGAMKANPVLLEPIQEVEVIVPDAFMGEVIGDLNSRRGRILGMEPAGGGKQRIRAEVPLAEMQRYAIDLRSLTQGRGEFSMKFARYEEAPPQVSEAVIAAAKAEQE